jgi:hypothetical protein
MPGIYSETRRPTRAGSYFNFISVAKDFTLPPSDKTAAIPFVHDWGPFKVPVPLSSTEDFTHIYGLASGITAEGYVAHRQAFLGEGLPGKGGVGASIAYRFGASSAAKANLALQNATPVAALKVWGRYEGTRGNALRVTVRTSAIAGMSEFVLYEGTDEIEKYTYTTTNVADLASQVNETSGFITVSGPLVTDPALSADASAVITGVALTAIVTQPLVGGDNGALVGASDFTAVTEVLETQRFGLLHFILDPSASYASAATGASILASLVAWVKTRNDRGQRFLAVFGGGLDETITDANTRSVSIADPNIVNCGYGSVTDRLLGVLAPYQWAARVLGILAQRGEEKSITFGRLNGVKIRKGLREDDIDGTFAAGTLILTKDNHPQAPVRIEKGLTTYTKQVSDTRDPDIFNQPKYVRTMHVLETEITEYTEINVIGQTGITKAAVGGLVANFQARLDDRVRRGVLQPGAVVTVTDTPDTAEYVDLDYGIKFAHSLEQLFSRVRVG